MMGFRRRWVGWSRAAGVLALLLATGSARAFEPAEELLPKQRPQPRRIEEARQHFSSGMKHFDEGAFPAAQKDFETAYELAPSYKLLYNLGLVARQLNNPARATQNLEAYLAQ